MKLFIILALFATNIGKEITIPKVVMSKKEIALNKQILKNKPNFDKILAKKLSKLILKYSIAFKADADRAVSIAMQESGYQPTINKNSNKTKDFGIFQVNTVTAKQYKLDTKKLVNDSEYAVHSYFKIMADKIRMCSKLKKDAWTCYHSKTASKRQIYKKLVNRYYVDAKK